MDSAFSESRSQQYGLVKHCRESLTMNFPASNIPRASMGSSSPFSCRAILKLATSIRNNGLAATFCFCTDTAPFDSGKALVYAVGFPDNVTWAVHVPAKAETGLASGDWASFVESKANLLLKLYKAGFRWSPKLIHYDTGHKNAIKHPYLILTWIHGSGLAWSDTVPSDPEHRAKILRQVVDIQLQLAERTRVLRPESLAPAFMTNIVDDNIRQAAADKESPLGIRNHLAHRALVRHAVSDSDELEPYCYAISHGHLTAYNIMVDSDLNVTGLIGWSAARILPLQVALRLPSFLAIQPDSPADKASPPPADIQSFARSYLQPSPALIADRFLTRSYLSSLVSNPNYGERQSPEQVMRILYADPDVNWRYLIIEACFSKELHAWLADRSWLLPGTKGGMAGLSSVPQEMIMLEMEDFLRTDGVDSELRKIMEDTTKS